MSGSFGNGSGGGDGEISCGTGGAAGGPAAGPAAGMDMLGRLIQMGDRTNMMVIDATLRAIPRRDAGYPEAVAEVRALARRIAQAAHDFRASIPAKPGQPEKAA